MNAHPTQMTTHPCNTHQACIIAIDNEQPDIHTRIPSKTKTSKPLWIFAGALILIPHLLILPSLPQVILGKGAPYVRTKAKTMKLAFDSLKQVIPERTFIGKTFIDLGNNQSDYELPSHAKKQGQVMVVLL